LEATGAIVKKRTDTQRKKKAHDRHKVCKKSGGVGVQWLFWCHQPENGGKNKDQGC